MAIAQGSSERNISAVIEEKHVKKALNVLHERHFENDQPRLNLFLVGIGMFYLLQAIGFEVAFIYCLLFGALISPTDPIAVLGILKKANAPKILETKIVGESLFNDGVGVVVFLTICNGRSTFCYIHMEKL